jgi:hypothetical protein
LAYEGTRYEGAITSPSFKSTGSFEISSEGILSATAGPADNVDLSLTLPNVNGKYLVYGITAGFTGGLRWCSCYRKHSGG